MVAERTVAIIGDGDIAGGALRQLLTAHPRLKILPPGTLTADVLLLNLGPGKTQLWLEENAAATSARMIDLGSDFRLRGAHDFVYGLPELHREAIRNARRVALPGELATAVLLALLPLAAARVLRAGVHIHTVLGQSEAMRVEHPFNHPQEAEILQGLHFLQRDTPVPLNLLSCRGPVANGITTTVYFFSELSEKLLRELYQSYYAAHRFVQTGSKRPISKDVSHSPFCVISVEKIAHKALLTCVLDRRQKASASQAVQILNLMFGWEEATGLEG